MSLKVSQGQYRRVIELIKKLCCNYDNGYCIALDDGEPCHCIQEISECHVCCNYFRNAVLPADRKLYEEIINQNNSDLR